MKFNIDPEFDAVVPEMSHGEIMMLTESCLKHGIRDPIKHWKGTIIDGRHRYEIAQKHNLPFKHEAMNFNSRQEVVSWIVRNQMARRNLTREQIKYLWGKHFKNVIMPAFEGDAPKSVASAAKEVDMSRQEASRAIEYAEKVDALPEEQKKAVLAGKARKRKPSAPKPKKPKAEPKPENDKTYPVHIDSWTKNQRLPKCLSMVDEIIGIIRSVVNEDEGVWLLTGPLNTSLDQVRDVIEAALFYDVCPECDGAKRGCDECRNSGWVPKYRHDELCGANRASGVPAKGGRKPKTASKGR